LLWIDLADGTTLIDRGDAITMRGRVTWNAALETAAAAERHRWQSVQVHGDQAYKDAVTMACLLRGIAVSNHTLSPKAQAAFERLFADLPERSANLNDAQLGRIGKDGGNSPVQSRAMSESSSRDIHLALAKRVAVPTAPPMETPDAESSVPVYKPNCFPMAKPDKRTSDRRQSDLDRAE
jgi:hypothetical protein